MFQLRTIPSLCLRSPMDRVSFDHSLGRHDQHICISTVCSHIVSTHYSSSKIATFPFTCCHMVYFVRIQIILKSDNEPAILALKREVEVQAKDVEIVLLEAPTGEHSANGAVEVAVRDQKRQSTFKWSQRELGKTGRHSSYVDLAESTCGILLKSWSVDGRITIGYPQYDLQKQADGKIKRYRRRSKEIGRCWEKTGRRKSEGGESRSNRIARSDKKWECQ